MAGSLSDVFGRRWTIVAGEIFALVGSVRQPFRFCFIVALRLIYEKIVACTAHKTLIVAVGSTIIGFGAGIIFVAYPGISELLPNKWR